MQFRRWKNESEILPEKVEEFVSSFNEREKVLKELEELASEEKIPILLPSSAVFLRFIASLLKPNRILEVGTGAGYSTLVLHFACPRAELLTVEINPKRAELASAFFERCGVSVDLRVGDAFEVARELIAAGEEFDLVFVDAVKAEYPFWNFKVQALLSPGGVAVFDNVLFRGYTAGVPHDGRYERSVKLLRTFLEHVKEYPGFRATLIPLGDGLLILERAQQR